MVADKQRHYSCMNNHDDSKYIYVDIICMYIYNKNPAKLQIN
jgi:hypothetical protein